MEYNYKQFKNSIASKSVAFKVNKNTIECNGEILLITNISSIHPKKEILNIKEPKPTFNLKKFIKNNPKLAPSQEEPEFVLNYEISITAMIIAFILTIFFKKDTYIIISSTIATGLVFLILDILKHNYNKNQWSSEIKHQESIWNEKKDKEKSEVGHKQKVWNRMQKNPPILHSLVIEKNAGTKTYLYSFNEQQIIQARNSIKRSMDKKEFNSIAFIIDIINIENKDSINNFGSEIYNQTVNN